MAFANPKQIIRELHLTAGQEVADFGAGAGHFALAAADIVGGEGAVYVIDIQSDLLTKAKSSATPIQLKALHFITGDLEQQNGSHLSDTLCDAVILANVLFQLEDKAACLREAFRVLKSGGVLLFLDWSDSFGGIGPATEHVVSKDNARELLSAAGFLIEREFEAGDFHYGLIAKKHG